jgi:hypothetical protein
MENCGIMYTMKKSYANGNKYTEVHVMDFRRERIWWINLENLDNESIPDTLREYVRENSVKIREGRWLYSGGK